MKDIQYRLVGFDLMQFAPAYEKINAEEPIEGNYGFDFAYNKNEHTVRATVNLNMTQNGETILTVQFATFVELKKDSAEALIKGSTITFRKEHQAQFASFGYGALRGVMYLKTINTPIENMILPPIELDDIFTNSLTISLED